MCFYGRLCVLDGGVCMCVGSCGCEWDVTAFAWFAAGYTVHSGTVILCRKVLFLTTLCYNRGCENC